VLVKAFPVRFLLKLVTASTIYFSDWVCLGQQGCSCRVVDSFLLKETFYQNRVSTECGPDSSVLHEYWMALHFYSFGRIQWFKAHCEGY